MHPATRSIFVFGVYLVINGVSQILFAPAMAANVGLPQGAEVAMRPLGMLLTIFGAMLIAVARQQIVPFFRITIWTRLMATTGLTVFVSLGLLPPAFLVFAAIDGLSAAWTWSAMREPGPAAAAAG